MESALKYIFLKVIIHCVGFRPDSKEGMLKLEDFPEAKVEKFGEEFIKVIKMFCEDNSLKMNNFPDDEVIKVISGYNN